MNRSSARRRACPLALLIAIACAPTIRGQAVSTRPAPRTEAEITRAIQSNNLRINGLIGDDAALADPQKRPAIAAEAVPLLKQFKSDFDELAALNPKMARQAKSVRLQVDQTLAILGDPEGTRNLEQMAASVDSAESLAGRGAQLTARWILAGKDGASQSKIADDVDALDRAHPESAALTIVTAQLSRSAATPEIADRLLKLATETMNNPAVAQVKMMRQQADAVAKLKQSEGKPFVLAATTVDGKPFTTADWLGKVVLVDFWATWCGPCKAELPNVQKLYADRHADGLEVVGVSNDFSADALRTFTAKANMPWPQLFDAAAAAGQQWNPTTLGYGIDGIPHMFVIDKKGVLRSADARETYQELVAKLLSE